MEDDDFQLGLVALRVLQLEGWDCKLDKRATRTQSFLDRLQQLSEDVEAAAAAQRELIISEMDHLKELLETKKMQLLSKNSMEADKKRSAIEAARARILPELDKQQHLQGRMAKVRAVTKEHAFLTVCQPLIGDVRSHLEIPVDCSSPTDATFRPFSVEAGVRVLGELDLGALPRLIRDTTRENGNNKVIKATSFSHAGSDMGQPGHAYYSTVGDSGGRHPANPYQAGRPGAPVMMQIVPCAAAEVACAHQQPGTQPLPGSQTGRAAQAQAPPPNRVVGTMAFFPGHPFPSTTPGLPRG